MKKKLKSMLSLDNIFIVRYLIKKRSAKTTLKNGCRYHLVKFILIRTTFYASLTMRVKVLN